MDDIPGTNPDYEHLPLIEIQEKLRTQVHELQRMKDSRLEYLKELRLRVKYQIFYFRNFFLIEHF